MNRENIDMLCPYRVLTQEHKAMTIGSGDCTTQQFYFCEGNICAAYHNGKCMRIQEKVHNMEATANEK